VLEITFLLLESSNHLAVFSNILPNFEGKALQKRCSTVRLRRTRPYLKKEIQPNHSS